MAEVKKQTKLGGYDFFRQVLGSPKMIVAPMVDASELAYRILCRRYGAEACWSPMLHSKLFAECKEYREHFFTTAEGDRPLVVQFCANDPEYLLQAARYVEHCCDAVDINLGCPQNIAKRGNYGSFLMNQLHLVRPLVEKLHAELSIPVTCKIRIFPELSKTLEYAKMLEDAGCQLLTVHGRTKEQRGQNVGLADWDVIKKVKETVRIPVIANGNLQEFADIERCMQYTGCDGVMSADAILKNPAFFSGTTPCQFQLAYEYLDICRTHETPIGIIRGHLHKMLRKPLTKFGDLREEVSTTRTIDGLTEVINRLQKLTNSPDTEQKPEVAQTVNQGESDLGLFFGQEGS